MGGLGRVAVRGRGSGRPLVITAVVWWPPFGGFLVLATRPGYPGIRRRIARREAVLDGLILVAVGLWGLLVFLGHRLVSI
jgi:hypothetical protein